MGQKKHTGWSPLKSWSNRHLLLSIELVNDILIITFFGLAQKKNASSRNAILFKQKMMVFTRKKPNGHVVSSKIDLKNIMILFICDYKKDYV